MVLLRESFHVTFKTLNFFSEEANVNMYFLIRLKFVTIHDETHSCTRA